MSGYHTESYTITQSSDIEKEWLDLQQRANHSYFQSWGWIETWLDQVAIDLQPVAVKVWLDENLVGISLFVSKDIKRRVIFQARAMYLNEYPFHGKNMITESNGLLVAKNYESEVYSEVVAYLLQAFKDHDEFCFGAMPESAACFITEQTLTEGASCIINEESVSRFIDLSDLQPGMNNYLASLSRNRRGQIRRSIRLYDDQGSLQIEQAENVEQALHYLDRLKVLHTNYWRSKGKGGAFSNPIWHTFHRTVIQKRFELGEIQLLKVSNQQGEIAYIYSFVLNKHVYVVQTGFTHSEDKRLMPGYVAHSMAIAYNLSKGMLIYDLMHGDELYKRILCNRVCKLQWLVIQRNRLKFTAERITVSLVRFLRSVS